MSALAPAPIGADGLERHGLATLLALSAGVGFLMAEAGPVVILYALAVLVVGLDVGRWLGPGK